MVKNFIVRVSLQKNPTVVNFAEYDKEYLASTNDEEGIQKPNQYYTNVNRIRSQSVGLC